MGRKTVIAAEESNDGIPAEDSVGSVTAFGGDERAAAHTHENDAEVGLPFDPIVMQLRWLSDQFMRMQKIRVAFGNQADAAKKQGNATAHARASIYVAALEQLEDKVARDLKREFASFVLWPWLSQFKGLCGPRTARFVGLLGTPHRFPGQKCSEGHIHSPIYPVGSKCPSVDKWDGTVCLGVMLAPRSGSGVRSLWHHCGLHVTPEGKSPRRVKGEPTHFNPRLRSLLVGPLGPHPRTKKMQTDLSLSGQIVMHRTPVYYDIYQATKARLAKERGADSILVPEYRDGPMSGGPESAPADESDSGIGLRPIQIERIARKVAIKAFVGDLLMEWKQLAPLPNTPLSPEYPMGGEQV